MNVPLLNYATMPVVQPRSEMQDFSNSLLQAGAMRQDRLKAEQERADRLGQQQFQNQMATDQFGLQQKADVRADQAQAMQGERHVADMATIQAQAAQRQREEAFQMEWQKPEMAAQAKAFQDSGDEIGLANFVGGSMRQHGLATPDSELKLSEFRTKALDNKFKQSMQPLEKQLLQARINAEMAQATAYRAQAAKAGQAGGIDHSAALKVFDGLTEESVRASSKTRDELTLFSRVLSDNPTESDLLALQAMPMDMAKLKAVADYAAVIKGEGTQAQKEMAGQQLRAKLEPELKARQNLLVAQEDALMQIRGNRDALVTATTGLSVPQAPNIAGYLVPGQQQQMQAPAAPERTWTDDVRDAIFGSPDTGDGYIPGSVRRRETPPSTTFKAKGDSMTYPTSDAGRPSAATSTTEAQRAPRYVDPAERTQKIQEISSKIQDIEKALPTLDISGGMYGPMNQKIKENSEKELVRLRAQLAEAEATLPMQRTPVGDRKVFTGIY